MSLFADISPVAPEEYARVVEVWEASVRAIHHFVAESDIEMFRPLVFDELPHTDLACERDENKMVAGFIGITEGKVEMLLIYPEYREQGIGRTLLRYVIQERGATTVDVNEQNDQVLGF
jgi:putative acetyltransferase